MRGPNCRRWRTSTPAGRWWTQTGASRPTMSSRMPPPFDPVRGCGAPQRDIRAAVKCRNERPFFAFERGSRARIAIGGLQHATRTGGARAGGCYARSRGRLGHATRTGRQKESRRIRSSVPPCRRNMEERLRYIVDVRHVLFSARPPARPPIRPFALSYCFLFVV